MRSDRGHHIATGPPGQRGNIGRPRSPAWITSPLRQVCNRALILACIVYWQARELSRLAAASDFPFDIDLISHISPIEWKNVILYGEIKIDPAKLRIRSP